MNMHDEFRGVLARLELLPHGSTQSWNKSSPPAELDRSPKRMLEQPPHLVYRWRWEAQTDDAGRALVLQAAQDELRAWQVRTAPIEAAEFDWVKEVLGMIGLTPKEVCARCNGIVSERQVIKWREADGKDPSTGQTPVPDEPEKVKALKMAERGLSVRTIAMYCDKPKSTVQDWLRDARRAA